MRQALAILALAGCYSYPSGWTVVGREPAGWRDIMVMAKVIAPCDLTGRWGGEIEVKEAPFRCGWQTAVGCAPEPDLIQIVYSPRARDTALAHEACHNAWGICRKDYTEAVAKACEARLRGMLP